MRARLAFLEDGCVDAKVVATQEGIDVVPHHLLVCRRVKRVGYLNTFPDQIAAKFEQLIDQAEARAAAERAAREQAQLDEVAINRAGGQGK